MIRLEDLKLSDIMPDRIKTPEILALFAALDPELQEITDAIDEVLIMTRIAELPEYIVDLLAWQLHVDFYDPLEMSLDQKRALVKNSLIWHRYKGTKYVLEEMIRTLFLDDFKIEEWFEYGGKPYFFRLVTADNLTDMDIYNDLIRAIYELKNERSWLEGIRMSKETKGTIYIGAAGKHVRRFEIGGALPEKTNVEPITVHVGAVGKHARRFEIFGKGGIDVKISDVTVNTGVVHRHTSKTMIRSSEEGDI